MDETVTTRDGRALHVARHGSGSDGAPTVVFEAGMGVSSAMWGAVVEALAPTTDVVVYDRSGLGASPTDREPRTLDRLADDLGDVLDHLGTGPFVLVGHSWGGPIVRVAAARRPDRIAGLVLVDPTDEGADLFFSKAQERTQRLLPAMGRIMLKAGLLRRFVARQAAMLPEPWATAMRRDDGTAEAFAVQLAELETHLDDLRRLRDEPLTVPDAPLVVITGAKTNPMERGKRGELIEAHRKRAATSAQGRHVRAERSGHYVPFTEPEVVVEEIRRIVDPPAEPGSP